MRFLLQRCQRAQRPQGRPRLRVELAITASAVAPEPQRARGLLPCIGLSDAAVQISAQRPSRRRHRRRYVGLRQRAQHRRRARHRWVPRAPQPPVAPPAPGAQRRMARPRRPQRPAKPDPRRRWWSLGGGGTEAQLAERQALCGLPAGRDEPPPGPTPHGHPARRPQTWRGRPRAQLCPPSRRGPPPRARPMPFNKRAAPAAAPLHRPPGRRRAATQ